ncbi:MAG: hypothetical protein S4CHLAM2_16340 [Chlamydiales bacterium]|nr:hypothetical protein [Chlamydiales bacterium]
MKGIIALDIDGTITVEKHHLNPKVNTYLNGLIAEGWKLIFITGRTFSFAQPILSKIKGRFFFAVQNGAALFEMPEACLIKKHYLSTALLPKLTSIFAQEPGGMLVESGKEQNDVCYFCLHAHSKQEQTYLKQRIRLSPEKWVALDSFEELGLSEFAVGKYFATEERAYALADKLAQTVPVKVIVIRDPFRPGHYLAHINERGASKGHILEEFRKRYASDLPVIGAGNDFNDVEMLEKSTFKIVMQNAPETMHALGDLVARPAEEQGIVEALKEAIRRCGRSH